MVFLEGKREMVERFLMATYLGAIACHPNATIKCFRPKSKTNNKPSREKKKPNKNDIRSNSSLSRCSFSSNMNITSSPPPNISSPSRNGRNIKNNNSYMVSTLVEEEPSFGVVEAIFRSGWDSKVGRLKLDKVLKVNHNEDVLNRFEKHREMVKSKSTNNVPGDSMRIERLAVDGNEFLRFYGAIVTCCLGNNKSSSICYRECCGICRMIGSCLTSRGEEPVVLSKNSQQAHKKVETECVNEICCARKAIVICRAIAGRVAKYREDGIVDGQEGSFDSVVSASNSEELTVLNARAVLPCFVIVYHVQVDKNVIRL